MGWFKGLFSRVFGPKPDLTPADDVLPNNAPQGFLYDLKYIPGAAQNNARNWSERRLAQTPESITPLTHIWRYPPNVNSWDKT